MRIVQHWASGKEGRILVKRAPGKPEGLLSPFVGVSGDQAWHVCLGGLCRFLSLCDGSSGPSHQDRHLDLAGEKVGRCLALRSLMKDWAYFHFHRRKRWLEGSRSRSSIKAESIYRADLGLCSLHTEVLIPFLFSRDVNLDGKPSHSEPWFLPSEMGIKIRPNSETWHQGQRRDSIWNHRPPLPPASRERTSRAANKVVHQIQTIQIRTPSSFRHQGVLWTNTVDVAPFWKQWSSALRRWAEMVTPDPSPQVWQLSLQFQERELHLFYLGLFCI